VSIVRESIFEPKFRVNCRSSILRPSYRAGTRYGASLVWTDSAIIGGVAWVPAGRCRLLTATLRGLRYQWDSTFAKTPQPTTHRTAAPHSAASPPVHRRTDHPRRSTRARSSLADHRARAGGVRLPNDPRSRSRGTPNRSPAIHQCSQLPAVIVNGQHHCRRPTQAVLFSSRPTDYHRRACPTPTAFNGLDNSQCHCDTWR